MSAETEEIVKVLYDYKYSDDSDQIEIKTGDLYTLIERTNDEWWQVYDPSSTVEDSFFVPAQYVQIVPQQILSKRPTDVDKTVTFIGNSAESLINYSDENDDDDEYSDASDFSLVPNRFSLQDIREGDNVGSYVNAKTNSPSTKGEGGYVNLDQYRAVTGIRNVSSEEVPGTHKRDPSPSRLVKPQTVPLPSVQVTAPPPVPDNGKFLRVLTTDMPWDVYKDISSGRLYYVNRETAEKVWKPPRKVFTLSDQSSLPGTSVPVRKERSGISPEQNQAKENGSINLLQKGTQEKEHSPIPPISLISQRPAPLLTSNSTGSLYPHTSDDVYEGYLYKTKIPDTSKKKVKKTYVVLQGSNLVFYKDQKSATQRQGCPFGRPEGVVSLQGAHLELNPKELTNKKNSISLRTSTGHIYVFQAENEKEHLEWFTRMKIVANDVCPTDPVSKDADVQEVRKEKDPKSSMTSMARSVSVDDTSNLHSADKVNNMIRIRVKLLNFISRRPTQEDLYKRGIIKDAVFGSKLHELCDREQVNVPNFVCKCIAAVELKGITHDGLYRVSGNMAEIQRLRCTVDTDDSYDLYDPQWDINVLTGALKLFFRELKEPIFTLRLYNWFINAIKLESRKEKLAAFKSGVADLPRCNHATLKELFRHLHRVMEASHKNRMQPQNIAIVFGPTLLWQQDTAENMAAQTVYQNKAIEFILIECNELFH